MAGVVAMGLPGALALVMEKPSASAGDIRDAGSIPRSGRCPGGGHGNPLQYSCLENPRDRGAWQATVHRVTKSQTRLKRLSTHTRTQWQWPWIELTYVFYFCLFAVVVSFKYQPKQLHSESSHTPSIFCKWECHHSSESLMWVSSIGLETHLHHHKNFQHYICQWKKRKAVEFFKHNFNHYESLMIIKNGFKFFITHLCKKSFLSRVTTNDL